MEKIEEVLEKLERVRNDDERFWEVVRVEKDFRKEIREAEEQGDFETVKKNLVLALDFYEKALKIVGSGETREKIITSFCAWETLADYKRIERPFVSIASLRPEHEHEIKKGESPITELPIGKEAGIPALPASHITVLQQRVSTLSVFGGEQVMQRLPYYLTNLELGFSRTRNLFRGEEVETVPSRDKRYLDLVKQPGLLKAVSTKQEGGGSHGYA
jgi:hypothetical protein